jgi:glycosyltransferase involved in cell wall biosynthesis
MISVVIPAFNEADTLPAHLARLVPVLDEVAPAPWEILVVDDGSTDRTVEVVEALRLAPKVRVLRAPRNRGKGAAVRLGVEATKGDMVLTCDADMSTPPETLGAFVRAMQAGADIVIGNRRGPEARVERHQPRLRRALGVGYVKLCQWLTRVEIDDFNCGFKLFRGDVAREVMGAVTTDGWAIDVESLALAARRGYRIVELPVVWRNGERTAVRLSRDIVGTFIDVLGIWWGLRRAGRTNRSPRGGEG